MKKVENIDLTPTIGNAMLYAGGGLKKINRRLWEV